MRFKLTIEYDGTGLNGWQRQEGAPTVQHHLEQAVLAFCGEPALVEGSGRTDAGVHGLGQVAHVDIAKETDANRLREALNYYLKEQRISVIHSEAVSADFHARFSAKQRHYLYRILCRRMRPTVTRGYVWHIAVPLDVAAMHEAAQLFVGHHNFTSFRSTQCQSKSPEKTLDVFHVKQEDEEIHLTVSSKSFLHNQVRIMVGSLQMVGKGDWSADDIHAALDARDRATGGPTAPAHGLYFMKVDY